jgi:sugar phosphate permease
MLAGYPLGKLVHTAGWEYFCYTFTASGCLAALFISPYCKKNPRTAKV